MTDELSGTRAIGAIVLAAGQGTRMRSAQPKVLHSIGGRPMIVHVLDLLATVSAERLAIVIGPSHDAVQAAVAPAPTAIQDPPLGTGHAAMAARAQFEGFDGDVFILFGDTPLIRPETLAAMLDRRAAPDRPTVVVLGMRPTRPNAYGRLVLGRDGGLDRIVEFKDASPEERAIDLCNSGVMLVDGAKLFGLLDRVG
ncbi:MAG: NTP transferase domain-containing protein, partial [Alphaproteobacteria bacterium]